MIPDTETEELPDSELRHVASQRALLLRERELFGQQTAVFSRILQVAVGPALAEEARSDRAAGWKAELRASLAGAPQPVARELLALPGFRQARLAAWRQLRKVLSLDGPLLPDEAEIATHSTELAQCVISNWLGLLYRALDPDHTSAQVETLGRYAAPSGSEPELLRGAQAYVLSDDALLGHFELFLLHLLPDTGVTEIMPQLYISSRDGSRIVSGSRDAAEKAALRLKLEQSMP